MQSVRTSDYFGRGTSVLFAPRTAAVSEAAGKTLAEISKQLRGQSTVIEVRGHVGASEAYGDPEAAMTLASDRALAAARRLAAGGIDWWRIRIVGAGSGERVEPFPQDAAADAKNSRVEVRVLDEVAAPREPAKRPADGVAGTGTLGAPGGAGAGSAPAEKGSGDQPAGDQSDAKGAPSADKAGADDKAAAKPADAGSGKGAAPGGARSSAAGDTKRPARPADPSAAPAGPRGAGAASGVRSQ